MRFAQTSFAALILAVGLLCVCAPAQDKPQKTNDPKEAHPALGNRLTIEVTGGDKNVPVENASVYVKFVEDRSLRKDKKFELNLKTNRDGVTQLPDAPLGKVLIQIVAEGWKTFGRYYDLGESNQTIKIHLDKPHRWY
ncbi:MAG: hypothetical protein ABSF92_02575 [Candidatus Acidiferrales bacterium]|jgi:hypothetical protein